MREQTSRRVMLLLVGFLASLTDDLPLLREAVVWPARTHGAPLEFLV